MTLKIKVSPSDGLPSLAHPMAPLQSGRTGTKVVEITDIPDGTPTATVLKRFERTADLTWLGGISNPGRLSFAFAELGEGVILRA